MEVLRYGRAAALVELGSLGEVIALDADLVGEPCGGLIETVPAARTLLVRFDPSVTTFEAVTANLVRRKPQPPQTIVTPLVTVPVRYDGADLAAVADLLGCPVSEVVERHLAGTYSVAFLGLAPGFYFLGGLAESLSVPRRPSPRPSVPKGAIGLAGEFCGIYPRTGPGGWQLIGTTDADLWDLSTHPSARLAPGTPITFTAATG